MTIGFYEKKDPQNNDSQEYCLVRPLAVSKESPKILALNRNRR
jgi:hypothetical protein